MKPALLSVVGRSGSGKTTLLERLIPALRALGLSVGAVKHHPEALETDRSGKDTWRLRRAGALASALVVPGLATFYVPLEGEEGWLDPCRRIFAPADLVLVEGFKHGSLPKIEVVGPGRAPLSLSPGPIARVVADEPAGSRVGGPADGAAQDGDDRAAGHGPDDTPVFHRDDPEGLARFLAGWSRRVSRSDEVEGD